MEDIITSKRHNLEQINQNTIQEYFEPEEKEDIYMQDKKDIQELQEEKKYVKKIMKMVQYQFIMKWKNQWEKYRVKKIFNNFKFRTNFN